MDASARLTVARGPKDDHTLSVNTSKRYATAGHHREFAQFVSRGFAVPWFAVRFNETLEGKAQPRCVIHNTHSNSQCKGSRPPQSSNGFIAEEERDRVTGSRQVAR